MASAQKSTGLQIALVFAVMSAIIAVVVAFLQYRKATDLQANLESANQQHTKDVAERQTALNSLTALKTFVGFPSSNEIGKPDSEGDGSVIGELKKVMVQVAPGDLAQPTVATTLQRLGQELDSLRKERAALTAKSTELGDRVSVLQAEYGKLADAHEKAKLAAEKDRDEAQASKEQAVKAKEAELEKQIAKNQELQAALQTANAELAKYTEETKQRIANLESINSSLRREKDQITQKSFEVPDGRVQWVDSDTGLVWIDRGEHDNLRVGTTFSVYKQKHSGVARGSQDIKGAIEVTRIIGPHQAEARITRSRNNDPIVPNDPIYTPLWQAGRQENFAFVGLIDLDHDGVSDRDVLHDVVAASNARIVDEVDDKGIRHPEQGHINVNTKFLVVGQIPDSSESPPELQEAHRKIAKLHEKMVQEAQESGVRIVPLGDFLTYVGYEPSRRIWRPGMTSTWNLRQGSHSVGTKPSTRALPQSSGATSGVFSRNPNLPQPSSSGQTSKLYNK
jgi:hypothetical protein